MTNIEKQTEAAYKMLESAKQYIKFTRWDRRAEFILEDAQNEIKHAEGVSAELCDYARVLYMEKWAKLTDWAA